MVKITIDPVTRATNGMRVMVELKDGSVVDSRCTGTSYRGIEQMLKGRAPMDAVYFTQRVCGMCSVSHAIASANAIENLCEATACIPRDALVVRNILSALGWLRSHIEHLYIMFLPDLADPMYREILRKSDVGNRVWSEFYRRFNAPGYASGGVTPAGEAYAEALKCIRLISRAEAILGGRSPNSPVVVPGGVTVRPTSADLYNLKECYTGIMDFLQKRFLGPAVTIDEWLSNTHDAGGNIDIFWNDFKSLPLDSFASENGWGDMQLFTVFCSRMMSNDYLTTPAWIELDTIGGYPLYDQYIGFLNYGSFYLVRDEDGSYRDGYVPVDTEKENAFVMSSGFTPGSMQNIFAYPEKVDVTQIIEYVSSSYFTYSESKRSLAPLNGETNPVSAQKDIDYDSPKYSFSKAPRYGSVPCEVGPLARLINSRERFILDVMKALQDKGYRAKKERSYPMASVYTRTLARMQETLIVAKMLGNWIYDDLETGGRDTKYYVPLEVKPRKTGMGLVEAPRGALGHWVKLDSSGRILNYQIISPTTWNASPRDSDMKCGPIELALLGAKTTPLGNFPNSETNPLSIYHIVRSFDPCVSCAVHMIRNKR